MTRENLKLAAVAVFCLTVGLAGPSVAGAVQKGLNADQVDGKHAVGAKASIAKRKNKLVATNKQGYLPGNIVQGQAALRTVSIPGFAINGTTKHALFGTNLPDAATDTAYLLFTLPPSYRRGTPVTVDVTHRLVGSPGCKVSLQTIGEQVSPSGGFGGGLTATFPNGLPGAVVTLSKPAGTFRVRMTGTVQYPIAPGDTLGLRIIRNGVNVSDDTCTGTVYISGALAKF